MPVPKFELPLRRAFEYLSSRELKPIFLAQLKKNHNYGELIGATHKLVLAPSIKRWRNKEFHTADCHSSPVPHLLSGKLKRLVGDMEDGGHSK